MAHLDGPKAARLVAHVVLFSDYIQNNRMNAERSEGDKFAKNIAIFVAPVEQFGRQWKKSVKLSMEGGNTIKIGGEKEFVKFTQFYHYASLNGAQFFEKIMEETKASCDKTLPTEMEDCLEVARFIYGPAKEAQAEIMRLHFGTVSFEGTKIVHFKNRKNVNAKKEMDFLVESMRIPREKMREQIGAHARDETVLRPTTGILRRFYEGMFKKIVDLLEGAGIKVPLTKDDFDNGTGKLKAPLSMSDDQFLLLFIQSLLKVSSTPAVRMVEPGKLVVHLKEEEAGFWDIY